jgi:predicted nucleic acid-binding protein
MILMDVNILVYAHRDETTDHPASRDGGEDTLNCGGAYGVSGLVPSGFLRMVTHPQVVAREGEQVSTFDRVNVFDMFWTRLSPFWTAHRRHGKLQDLNHHGRTSMLAVRKEFANLRTMFASPFTKRVWQHVQVLLVGAILNPGKRTITAVLRVMGLAHAKSFQ